MNILIIFDHSNDESYCLRTALDHCLRENKNIYLSLKNLSNHDDFTETNWFSELKARYNDRITKYAGATKDESTQIICSLSPSTPFSFLSRLKPSKIGLFYKQKIITTDYASPFLILKNTPNKLNRENLYDLILNGKIDAGDKNKDTQENELKTKYITNNLNINKQIYNHEKIFINSPNDINIINLTTANKEITIRDQQENIYTTKKSGPFHYLRRIDQHNLLEEIIHLSMMFTIFNIDYVIEESEIENKQIISHFNDIIENFYEAVNFTQHFITNLETNKAKEALNLSYKSLESHGIFQPILEYFYTINNSSLHHSQEELLLQLHSNCETMKIICKTIYHLTSKKGQQSQIQNI